MPVLIMPPGFPVDPTQQAEGAWPKGTPVEKAEDKPGDMHPKGTRGKVVGSIYAFEAGYGYFVLFESNLHQPVFVVEKRLRKVELQP